ncbi:50S ribosomal protein L3 [Ignatzschineria sp. RMDPL8A]|mgnify:CR=1 FL=1|uniref:50S ribosomal protein L3 n=1 Tax=Ignatzschineria sp. RMDPL8A TaxID=2999236 RepID=UPI0016B84676|nr:50S ribosomal protein L3 [Ignatzschineria sp. RMDPL8A]MDG9729490.1 50S ribosomal protein L3 [Ignatzschineria sp. RMDPL8A]NLD07990.1 50S ribosomal protein L3 [Xanthomonadaceae bacterium]
MAVGLIGKKLGMSRVFGEDGRAQAVTVVEVDANQITQIKTDAIDGYTAIQVAVGKTLKSKKNKAQDAHFAKANVEGGRALWEFRVDSAEIEGFELAQELNVALFEVGQKVDVSGITQGKGYAGTIKRHNFTAQRNTHGNSVSHRVPGSIGQCQDPGRVFKGKKMTGHMGAVRRTTQNLEIVSVDADRNLLLIKGAIPGPKGSNVVVSPAVKIKRGKA